MHHALAHSWLRQQADDRWATCPFTEAAFVRLSCNPRVVQRTLLPAQALDVLRRNTEAAAHVFWPDDLPFLEAVAPASSALHARLQVVPLL